MEELKNYSDDALRQLANEIVEDLEKASVRDENYDPEWHESCFAAICVVGSEMLSRGLRRQNVD